MTDWGASQRTDSYEAVSVDPFTLQETGERLELNWGETTVVYGMETDNFYSASISTVDPVSLDRLIRLRHSIEIGGEVYEEVLGTFFVDTKPETALRKRITRKASCYSTLWRVMDDTLRTDFYRAYGENVVEAIEFIAQADGGLALRGTGCATHRTFGRDIFFPLGDNKGETMQEIAGWVNNVVLPDPYGYLVIQGIPDPATAAIEYVFEEGDNCTYLPGATLDDTHADGYNRVIASWSRSSVPKTARKDENGDYVKDGDGNTVYDDDDDFGLSGNVCVQLPATHPFAFERIGRNKTYHLKVTEPCSAADLEAQAQAFLNDNCGSTDYIEIEHLGIPGLRPYAVVMYRNDTDFEEPIIKRCQIVEMDMTLSYGCRTKTKMKVIA